MEKRLKPLLIIIDGPIGVGKSTLAKILHKKLKRTALISLDRIKHLISDFRAENHEDLQLAADIGAVMTKTYLKKNINVIVEKAFTQEVYLSSFLKKVNNINSKTYIYQLEAPEDIRIRRVKQRPYPSEIKKKPSKEKIFRNTINYNLKYKKAKVFDSSKLTSLQISNRILKEIKMQNVNL